MPTFVPSSPLWCVKHVDDTYTTKRGDYRICLPSIWLSHCPCDRLNNCRAPRRCIYIESTLIQIGVDSLLGPGGRYIASGASTVVLSLITGICDIRSTGTKRW